MPRKNSRPAKGQHLIDDSDNSQDINQDTHLTTQPDNKYQTPEFIVGQFDLVWELENRRHFYFAPREDGLDLTLKTFSNWAMIAINAVCSHVALDNMKRGPGIQPAISACIAYGLTAIQSWPEAVSLATANTRRHQLPLDTDGDVLTMIDSYLGNTRIPTIPQRSRETPKIKLSRDWIGGELQQTARALGMGYNTLASLCVLAALVDQPEHVNASHKKNMANYLAEIRRNFKTWTWGAEALMDRLETHPLQVKSANSPNPIRSSLQLISPQPTNPKSAWKILFDAEHLADDPTPAPLLIFPT